MFIEYLCFYLLNGKVHLVNNLVSSEILFSLHEQRGYQVQGVIVTHISIGLFTSAVDLRASLVIPRY